VRELETIMALLFTAASNSEVMACNERFIQWEKRSLLT
jgi:hypothetical protein